MSYFKSQLQEEESSRSFDGKSEVEEGLFSFRDDEISSPHLTWSTFDDLDDSGHFTASPEGERTFCGSSPSHSPCPTSAQLLLQMQNQENNNVNLSSQFKQHPLSKPLISPRSIMTVTVPHTTSSSVISFPSSHDRGSHKLVQPSTECSSASGTVMGDDIQPTHRRNSNHNVPAQPLSLQEEMAEALQSQAFSPEPKKSQSRDNAPPMTLPFPKSNDESSEYLRSMLENFNCLYMEKLRMIDDLAVDGDADQKKLLMEKKTNMLEQWAKDVCVQNMVLVHTVEELEREANRKVSALQQKINESTQLAKEHMTMISKYEQQVKLLLKNHSDTEESNLVLKIELEKLKSECRRVRDRMNLLLKDNESVITLVCRIRDMGVWDVNGLELQRSSFDQIFGLYPNLVGSEVQTVFTKEKAKQAQYTEERAVQLENQLDDLHKSQKETKSCSLQKDRKIEELETEINNLSNKVQYCEQECNDYKRSLLETQEKLLEATRRLNATPKISKPTTTPEVNEMTELIRELRDVKSQLNTAVDEKQTARDESNYFKKELSDRLKEMHDIQNVFHSLATEVVSSRAAFQQVQEKEVQLQSLKSEVHTYQSRCADADDTIRKKEEEIRQLQTQMNQIHKKKKKQKSYLSSTSGGTELTSDKPASTMLSFYQSNLRNISASSKIPVRKSITSSIRSKSGHFTNKHKTATHNVLTQTSEQGSNKKRPPWNTNFKKSMGLISIPASELPVVSRSSLSKETQSSTRQLSLNRANSQDSLRTWKGIHRSYDDITTEASSFMANGIKSQQAVSDQIYSNYRNNKEMASISTLTPKKEIKEDPQKKRLKLPKIESKTRAQKKSPVNSTREGVTNGEKLPMVDHVLPKFSKTKGGPPKKLDNPVLKNLIDNPLAHTPRLNELINAVVETSKQLLGSGVGKSVLDKGSLSGLKITAAHYRKNRNKVGRQKTLVRRVKSSDKNAEVNRCKSEAINSPKLPRKHHSSTLVTPSKEEKDDVKITYESPRDVNAFLNGLPRESQEDIVKGWIAKSSSQLNNSKNVKRIKTPISARRPSLKVMRHLATRRCPRQTQAPAKTKANDEDESKTKMFDLEDEWGKVFANLECTLPGSGDGASKMDKMSGELSGTSEIVEEQQTPSTEPTMESSSSSANEAPKSEENACKEESMQELLDRLAAEKLELEERYKKELHDRDIEIRMQKNGTVEYSSPSNSIPVNAMSDALSSGDACTCASCLNRRNMWQLINQFEDHKKRVTDKLWNIKLEGKQLDRKTNLLDESIRGMSTFMNGQEQSQFPLPPLSDLRIPHIGTSTSVSSQFTHDLHVLKNLSSLIDKRLRNKFTEVKKPCEQQDVFQGKHSVEAKLKQSCESNTLLLEKVENLEKVVKALRGENEPVEPASSNESQTQLQAKRAEHDDNNYSGSGDFAPLWRKLEAMKNAFNVNESIIFTQNQQLLDTTRMISTYEMFVTQLGNIIGKLIPSPGIAWMQDVTEKQRLTHLFACVKQAVIDNGLLCEKQDSLKKLLEVATRENGLLNETIASLTDNIDTLTQQNDKLLRQFIRKRSQECRSPLVVSNLSSPRSDIWDGVENESSVVRAVDTRASGDFCIGTPVKTFSPQGGSPLTTLSSIPLKNDDILCPSCSFLCSHSRKSEVDGEDQGCRVQMPMEDVGDDEEEDEDAAEFSKNLKLMEKCLLDLDKSWKGILDLDPALPRLFHDPNFCLSNDYSVSIAKLDDDGSSGNPADVRLLLDTKDGLGKHLRGRAHVDKLLLEALRLKHFYTLLDTSK